MKTSKYRFAKASPCMSNKLFLNVQPTSAIWDCGNFIACNENHVAVPWNSLGSVVVLRHDAYGKMPTMPAMLTGHEGAIIDLQFSPFDPNALYTASEDCTIKGWKLPEEGITTSDTKAMVTLRGHSKKVGILSWHPSASNVLASASPDATINLWDVEMETPKIQLKSRDQITSLNWNLDGSLLNTTTKDKRLNVIDSRTGECVMGTEAHASSKTCRSIWAKKRNLIVTLGFNKQQHRQAMVWDTRNMDKALHVEEIDQQSSVMMPHFDEDTNMLYVAGKGDGSIKLFDLWEETTPLVYLNSHSAPNDPQKGIAMMPKKVLDVKECEVSRFYKLGNKQISHIKFNVPRKQGALEFQTDIYPPTFASTPVNGAEEFFAGKNAAPSLTNLEGNFKGEECTTAASGVVSHDSPIKAKAAPKADEKKADAEWDGKTVATAAQHKAQTDAVAALAKQLEAAQAKLAAMDALAKPAEEPKKKEEAKAEEPKAEEKKAEEPKAEEKKVEAEEAKKAESDLEIDEEPVAAKAEAPKAEEPKAEAKKVDSDSDSSVELE